MRAMIVSAALVGGAACQLSLGLDHTFHADAGDGEGVVTTRGGSGGVAPGEAEGGSAGSATASSTSGASGVLGGSGGDSGYPPDGGAGSNSGGSGGASGGGGDGAGGGGPLVPATCTGCVELIVPVSTTGDKAVFEFQLDDAAVDLSDAVITWRVQAVNDTAADWSDSGFMVIKAFAQSPPPPQSNPPGFFTEARLLSLENFQPNTWHDLVFNVASFPIAQTPSDFDKTNAIRIGLELAAGSNFFGTHSIRVFVDSVVFSGVPGLSNRSFDTDVEGFVLNDWQVPMSTRLETHFEP